MIVAAVIAAGTMTAGAASAAHPVGPDYASLMAATWYGLTPDGQIAEPSKQLRVEKVLSTSDFNWDEATNKDEWWVPSVLVGDDVPKVARFRGPLPVMTHNTSVIKQERISGNRYKLTVPGGVLEAVLEPRSGW